MYLSCSSTVLSQLIHTHLRPLRVRNHLRHHHLAPTRFFCLDVFFFYLMILIIHHMLKNEIARSSQTNARSGR
jgi:hypothetical protein